MIGLAWVGKVLIQQVFGGQKASQRRSISCYGGIQVNESIVGCS